MAPLSSESPRKPDWPLLSVHGKELLYLVWWHQAPEEGDSTQGRRVLSNPPVLSESWEEKKKLSEVSTTLRIFPPVSIGSQPKFSVFCYLISFAHPFQKPWGSSVISEKCMSLYVVSEKRRAFYSPHEHRKISSEEETKLPLRESFTLFPEKKK